MLAESLRLLPPLKSWHFDFNDTEGFRSLYVISRKSSPKKLMLEGRRHDVRAVFEALPVGSFWYVIGSKEELDLDKNSEEDWDQLEHYMETEERRPALTSILNDQRKALSNAICQRFGTSNIPEPNYRNVFGKELRMRDVFLF